ncbi:hypothetical protein CBS147345_6560 [Aspergillus niger]|nr:hypothetical protein CBS147345_6560 [Aspergillus niger]
MRKLVCQQLLIDGHASEEHGLYFGASTFLEQLTGSDQSPTPGPNLEGFGISSKDFNILKSILTSPTPAIDPSAYLQPRNKAILPPLAFKGVVLPSPFSIVELF